MIVFGSFKHARQSLRDQLLTLGYDVHSDRWQGIDVRAKPEMRMREVLNTSFTVALHDEEDPEYWEKDTGCNLPFAIVHFAERVGREPTNPGEAWKIWPWGHNASKFLEHEGKQFSHTYQERFWPRYANEKTLKTIPDEAWEYQETAGIERTDVEPRMGIRYEYGDLDDLVNHLANDPLSRQAYIPIWFPEDGTCPGRKPCSLGFHFINRGDHLHITYYIRSCDFVRHWADDCYLTIRLLLWVLDELRKKDARWNDVKPGLFSMHIVSLHCFQNDLPKLKEENESSTKG